MKITLSVIKADIGGFPGHVSVHPDLIATAEQKLKEAQEKGQIIDFKVLAAGDDLELIMTHTKGVDNEEIHKLAWDTFLAGTEVAKKLKLYGAGQDLLADTFSGNVKGMGPGVAEIEFEERPSEPVIIFMADKCSPAAWNLPLFRIFADPFNTSGLVIDPKMTDGFKFEIHDIKENKRVFLKTPEDTYTILALIGNTARYVIKSIESVTLGIPAAVASTQRLALIAGRYVGKDDPVLIVRAQNGLPSVGEITEAFAFPHLVEGWMRGSHNGPLMPVSFKHARPLRFDGPPRVIAAGFQLAEGKLHGPVDMFDDPAFDLARTKASEIAEYMRRHGIFEPHRLPADEMEYTRLPQVLEKLKGIFEDIE